MRAVLAMSAAVMALCLTTGAAQADAQLTSHWQFGETSGTTTTDTVTAATATLSGGVAFGPGKSGNGLVLSGGTATGPLTVDTAQSFTVSAWVTLSAACTANCKLAAVSADGVRSSRFSLGYVKDRNHLGNWNFVVAEADTDLAPVTATAVSVVPVDAGQWTHVVGVYDAENLQTLLFVDGNLVGAGRAENQWSGTGTFTVGAARKAGATTSFFPGAVDEVRFYDSALNMDEVFALYLSEA
ncbi:LamG domain-containing protein [Lentzea guizhouensis]|nr:LamG domain-containing protein [Lentzea guizhouensis]